MSDDATLKFYETEAHVYTMRGQAASHACLASFMAALPKGGSVLELGCGAGQDSEAMLSAGFDVTPTDGTPAIAKAAQVRLKCKVEVLLFADVTDVSRFDGVWANACLLHLPRHELPEVIARIGRALKAGGIFYASYKAGDAEGRDRFGRFYNYMSPAGIEAAYGTAIWASLQIDEEQGSGYDQLPTRWLHVTATKAS